MGAKTDTHAELGQPEEFWIGLVEIPRVKGELVEAVLMHEIGKAFPMAIPEPDRLSWDCLDSLFPPGPAGGSAYLVSLAYQAGNRIHPLQALARHCQCRRGPRPAALALLAPAGSEVLAPDAAGKPGLRLLDGTAPLEALEPGQEPGLALVLPNAGHADPPAGWRALSPQQLAWSAIARLPRRNDSRSAERRWRRWQALGLALVALLGLLLAARHHLDSQNELRTLRSRITTLQQRFQLASADAQERTALAAEIAALEAQQPVQVYRLLEAFIAILAPEDRLLGVQWDGDARTLGLELASPDPLGCIERVDRSGLFASAKSGGMTPLAEDPRLMRFSIKATLEAP